jgi:hypothetical protein
VKQTLDFEWIVEGEMRPIPTVASLLFSFLRPLFAFADGLTQDILDLAVDAAEFVRRPFFQVFQKLRRNSQ